MNERDRLVAVLIERLGRRQVVTDDELHEVFSLRREALRD